MTAPESTPPRAPPRGLSGASLGLAPEPGPESGPDLVLIHEAAGFDVSSGHRYVDGGALGRGGMGEIRVAFDVRLARRVAIKTPVLRDPMMRRQFVAEAKLTAGLVHPGIVAVHDAGVLPDGRPYYTMPIIEGRSLAQAIADATPSERLRLVRHYLDACEAVGYAHSEGIVHRDLKPANILDGRFGETLVVDWGLAGPLGARPPGIVGTPSYMAPEQARGDEIDARADVFALGVSLREIITGGPRGDTEGAPAELLAIAARATAPDPAQRYADGHALAEDVAAWFEGRRVAAHRYGLRELALRLWATHRVPLVAALLAITGIALATIVGYVRTAAERARAVQSEQIAVAARGRAEHALAQAEVAQAVTAMGMDAWADAELFAAGALTHGPSPQARGVLARFDGASRPRLLRRIALPECDHVATTGDGSLIACAGAESLEVSRVEDTWSPFYVTRRFGEPVVIADPTGRVVVREPDGRVSLNDPSASDETLVVGVAGSAPQRFQVHDRWLSWVSGTAELWADLTTGGMETTRHCFEDGRSAPGAIGRRHDGTRIVACQDGGVFVVPPNGTVAREVMRLPLTLGGPVLLAVAPHDDDPRVAIALAKGGAVVIDLDARRVVRTIAGAFGSPSSVTLGSSRLALADDAGRVDVWEVDTGALVVRLAAQASQVRWREDGTVLRVIGTDVEDYALSAARGRSHVQLDSSGVASLALSPDGIHMASVHGDGHLRLARVDGVTDLATIPLHWSVAKDVEFSPDGRRFAAISAQDDTLRVFDLDDPLSPVHLEASGGARLAWLADDLLVLAPYGVGLAAWRDGALLPGRFEHLGRVVDLEADADRGALTLLTAGGEILRADATLAMREVAWRGDAIAVAGAANTVVVVREHSLEIVEGRDAPREVALAGNPAEVALSPDTRHVAVGFAEGTVAVYATDTLELLALLRGHRGRTAAVTFDSRGGWIASGSWDGDLRQWSLRALERPALELLAEAERDWGLRLEDRLAVAAGAPEPQSL